jgi:hypothetical protein
VKKRPEIKAFPIILLCFCFIFSLSFKWSKSGFPSQGSSSQANASTISASESPFAAHLERTVRVFQIVQESFIKYKFNGLSGLPKAIEQISFVENAAYLKYAEYISGRLETTDIIFPFHYFW